MQRANMERDLYKSMADESLKLKERVGELEALSQKRAFEVRTLQAEAQENAQYKTAYDYMKEEHVKIKSERHLQALELEKLEA